MSAKIFSREEGHNKGFGGSMYITDMSIGIMGMNGIVGASYYIAAGAALTRWSGERSRWPWPSSETGRSPPPTTFSAARSCANDTTPLPGGRAV